MSIANKQRTHQAIFSERAQALKAIPIPDQIVPCESFCSPLLVDVTDTVRRWRCERCLRYIEAPISRQHEIEWRKPETPLQRGTIKPREALPDQQSLFDISEGGNV